MVQGLAQIDVGFLARARMTRGPSEIPSCQPCQRAGHNKTRRADGRQIWLSEIIHRKQQQHRKRQPQTGKVDRHNSLLRPNHPAQDRCLQQGQTHAQAYQV